MSLFESGHSTGDVSLTKLLQGDAQPGQAADLSVPDLMERIVIGGWPALLDAGQDEARAWVTDYIRQVAEVDLPSLGPRRNPRNIRRLLESLARTVGQPAKLTEIAKDVGGAGGPIAQVTLRAYLDALERLMLTDLSQAWQPHMHSRTRLRSTPVRYFVDPSLGTPRWELIRTHSLQISMPQASISRAWPCATSGSTHSHCLVSWSHGVTQMVGKWTRSSRSREAVGLRSRSSSIRTMSTTRRVPSSGSGTPSTRSITANLSHWRSSRAAATQADARTASTWYQSPLWAPD